MAHHDATLVAGVIAIVTSHGLIISRQIALWKIRRQKILEELHPYMYMTYISSFIFWTFYSESEASIYNGGKQQVTGSKLLRLCFLCLGNKIGMVYEYTLMLLFLYAHTISYLVLHVLRTHYIIGPIIFGPIAVVFGIIMHATPLFFIIHIYKTKRIGCWSFLFCLTSFLNGIVWFIFALLPTIDIYLAIANGIGILLGIVQLGLIWLFREKPQFSAVQVEDGEDVEIV
ncbi:hypothetical protein ACJIZ3_010651 [Penstemon smallii]|uniref:Bidirectional sugar transporter SWEET n=1 Tax=Penstemon smallii TaxID=265156 RepID=A0ABD3UGZ1_9LAMI